MRRGVQPHLLPQPPAALLPLAALEAPVLNAAHKVVPHDLELLEIEHSGRPGARPGPRRQIGLEPSNLLTKRAANVELTANGDLRSGNLHAAPAH